MNNYEREIHSDPYSATVREALTLRSCKPSTAYEKLAEVAAMGSPMANMILGDAHLMGRNGLTKDEDQGERFLRRASKLGSLEGAFRLARYLEAKKLNSEAIQIYENLSEARFAPAAFVLGVSYTKGTFTEKDLDLGTRYLKVAADEGHLHAKDWLAQLVLESEASFPELSKALATRLLLKKRIQNLTQSDPASDLIRTG
ncbi:hypothetical protein MACH24_08520 [Erythrobacter sp. Dej080120_24]|jgi:TPR repeat protein|uniref:tetratricopeptide repeat protein n=1 Tax=Erythrobacter sp. Dej080120_24 TaxID=3024837 RepID=UPI0029249C77|nr:hypothetical protein MACH24_08520 [Erythrobacter sp. Dej080120_24]